MGGASAAAKKATSKEGGPRQESGGEDIIATDGVVTNARMLKRKRLTPPGSPAVSKRPPRGESPHTTANGEPTEPVSKKLNASDLNAAKPDVAKKPESLEPGVERKLDQGTKACSNSQGDLQVSPGATTTTADQQASAGPKAADVDTSGVGDQSQSVVQVSSSLATSSVTTQAEDEKHHTIPSHAGRGSTFFRSCIIFYL